MSEGLPRAWGELPAIARLRAHPGDFVVDEVLGFEPEGSGEHVFLQLRKTGLNTGDLAQRLSELSGISLRDIGFCGLKDRQAVTSQWFSVRMAGRDEPDWQRLEGMGDIRLLQRARHRRKLKRGVHRGNRFSLRLRDISGDRSALEKRLQRVAGEGVPNYFGEQRFGRGDGNLDGARRWMVRGGRLSRSKRSLYLSALRAMLFNTLLAERVRTGCWNRVLGGDMCILQGSRSQFACEHLEPDIERRAREGDLHPALPLWGRGAMKAAEALQAQWQALLADELDVCRFLEEKGLELAWRPCRVLPDDFSWEFCDDGALQLEFGLPRGSYATALVAELVQYRQGDTGSDNGSE